MAASPTPLSAGPGRDSPAPHAPRARRRGALRFLLSLAGLLVLVDLLLAAIPSSPAVAELDDAQAIRRRLRASAEAEGERWLLIGDSVLVGDTGRESLPRWQELRLID